MWMPPRAIMQAPVLMRLLPSLFRRYAKAFKWRFTVEKRMGALFLIDQLNLVDKNLLIRGAWDREQVERFFALAERHFPRAKGPRQFWDIGAHGALYAILFAGSARPDDRIDAVECDPVNRAQLMGNLFVNGLVTRVSVHPFAVSDAAGSFALNIAPDTNRGGSRLDTDHVEGFAGTCMVQAKRMDDLWDGFAAPIIAKIDVEGHEEKVLRGMETMLAACPALIQIEIFPESIAKVTAQLEALGFSHLSSFNDDHYFLKAA